MKKSILVYSNEGKKRDFQTEVERVRDSLNFLIAVFNNKQQFKIIETIEDFQELITSPVNYFDQVVREGLSLPQNGLTLNMAKACELYSIDRKGYFESLHLQDDMDEDNEGCSTCKRPERVHLKGSSDYVVSYDKYLVYSDFLTLRGGFILNQDVINKHLKTFDVVASTPAQLELYNHYITLTKNLNGAIKWHNLSTNNIEALAKMFGLLVLNNQVCIHEINLSNEIKYIE